MCFQIGVEQEINGQRSSPEER